MFGKYSFVTPKEMSPERTNKIVDLIKKFGGEVSSMYTLLGEKDLIFIVSFPETQQAIKASVAVSKLTGISFRTSQAVTIEEFDKIVSEV
jgi:uncharacterized protein with GYD domain